MSTAELILLGWLTLTSVLAFGLFGYDKFQSGRNGSRAAEFQLAMIGAIGGWLGGLAGMLVFRHKTAKLSFILKYAVAFVFWSGWLFAWFASR